MNDQIHVKVRSIVEKFLDKNHSSEISDTTKLITLGYIDSFSIVELISILETEFSFQFDPATLKLETFDSINSISEAVELATQTKFLKHA